MENNMYVSSPGEGITFRAVRETRFKNACISVHFLLPLSREYATVNSVMMYLLHRSCARYPKYNEFRRELAMLYGADVTTSVSNIGNCQMLTVEIAMTDDRFLPDGESISRECAALLSEIIFRPVVDEDGELFRSEDIEASVRVIRERIQLRINDKAEYASHRCIEIMCEGELLSVEAGGYIEDLPTITRKDLAGAWRRMLSLAAVNIIMVGAVAHEPVEEIFAREFAAIDRRYAGLPDPPKMKEDLHEREVVERMDVRQSKMIIGMRLPVIEPDDRTMAARLMSMIYGGGTSSLLFNNVREKLSLCYYCSSMYLSRSGLMFVSSGIEEKNYRKAVEEIKNQLSAIADNEFTDEVFEATQINDSIGSIERWYCMQFLDGCVRTPEQAAERLKAVTRSQVAECASLVRMDTIYLLAPENREENSGEEGGAEQ